MTITHHEIIDDTIEFYDAKNLVIVSAELDREKDTWLITNCETGIDGEVPASEDRASDAQGIIAAVMGSTNDKAVQD